MNNKKLVIPFTRKALMLSVLFLTILMSCKKEGELYPEFNNENLTTQFTDTLNIVTTLIREDSIQTLGASYNLLGIYNDSIFGPASASFYTEITLAGSNVNFEANALIDSVVLSLKYANTTSSYGGNPTTQTIDVHRLTANLSNTRYYSNETITHETSPLGSLTFLPNLKDSVVVTKNGTVTTLAPHVRIRLSDSFGQEILDAGKDANYITDNAELLNLVKGLYITPSTTVNNTALAKNEGAIIYYDMNSSLSTLTIFYRNDSVGDKSYSFLINSESKKFNHFDHNYSNTEIEKQLTGISFDSTLTYVQAMAGVKTKLMIPNLKNLGIEGKIIVNKAEIIFPVSDISANLDQIPSLALTAINSSGQAIFLPDDGNTNFGGEYDKTNRTYTFNISRHIQDIINNDKIDYGMYLVAKSSATIANRSIINSFKHPSNNIKLNITYSKF